MKYTLPALKKEKNSSGIMIEGSKFPDRYDREITIPVNDEMLQKIKTGEKMEIELFGEIVGTEKRETSENNLRDRTSITMRIASVTIDDGNEFTKLAEDD